MPLKGADIATYCQSRASPVALGILSTAFCRPWTEPEMGL